MYQHHSSITPDDVHAVVEVRVALPPLFSMDPETIADTLNGFLASGVSTGLIADYAFYRTDEPCLVHSSEEPVEGELFLSPDSGQVTNASRAHSAQNALAVFAKENGLEDEDIETQLSDIVTNLMHLCAINCVDFGSVLARAEGHYAAEIEEER